LICWIASGGGGGDGDRTSGGGGVGGGIGDSRTVPRDIASHCGGHEKGRLAATLGGVMIGVNVEQRAAATPMRTSARVFA
jgi:hypothetical protein